MSDRNAEYWIQTLKLTPHAEGGAFAETYRSGFIFRKSDLPSGFQGDRNASTAIYFLLKEGQYSAFHRIASDEMWHFYAGSPLKIYEIRKNGALIVHVLGNDPEKGQTFQCLVEAGSWFGSRNETPGSFTLCGCTVAPGFDFEDFELASGRQLSQEYPQHSEIIAALTPAEI